MKRLHHAFYGRFCFAHEIFMKEQQRGQRDPDLLAHL
jgi:hypothetical protein